MSASEMGWKMRNIRKVLGVTRTELAQQCGVKKRTIKQIEHGRLIMSAELLARVSMALGVSADYLLGLSD